MDWLKALLGIIAIIRGWFDRARSAEDRAAGRAEANSDTLARNAEAVRQANEAEIEADKDHKSMPGDEAFDQDFKRRD